MKSYLISFAVGLMVGCIYSFLKVRSPAPPLIALVGLLGIVLGEQSPALVKQLFIKDDAKASQVSEPVGPNASTQRPNTQRVAQMGGDLEGKS